jgi:hypothetical protein
MGDGNGRELHLRLRLLWSYHKSMESGKLNPEDVYNEPAYIDNIEEIQKHIDLNQTGGLIFFAELHRFADRFEEAAAIFEEHLDNIEFAMVRESHHRCFEHDRRTYKMS